MNKLNRVDVTNLLKSGKTAIGLNQVLKMLSAGKVQTVVLAEDSDEFIKKQIYDACGNNINVALFASRRELGELSGLKVGASAVAILR